MMAGSFATIWAVPPHTVSRWDSHTRAGGDPALAVNGRGRRKGEPRHRSLGQDIALWAPMCRQHRRRWGCRLPCGPGERSRS